MPPTSSKNKKSPAEDFFQKLTRLFRSGPSIQRRIKGHDSKSYYSNKLIQGNYGYKSSAPLGFGRENSPFSVLGSYGILDRMARYAEFSEMDTTPEIASALDVYSDEVVGGDDRGKCFHVYSQNKEIKEALDDLFYDVLNVEFNLRTWVRNLLKYGDFFLYVEVAPDMGIIMVTPIPVNEIEREEGYDVEDPYSWRFKWLARGNKYLENWQVTHLRILNNDLFLPYGSSILEPARRVFRQLTMLEDAMLVYRIIRSPERRVFYIDVGNIDPNDVPNYMEAAKATLRSQSSMDREHGREDQRLNAMSILDDYFIPVRGAQQGTRVETISGGTHATATEDVEYIQRKLFAAMKVPKPYLNFDENLSSKASLSQMDVRFSRTVQMIQKIVVAELNRLAMIHLYSKGFDGADLINFQLKLSNPSSVALQQKLELWSVKFDTAGTAKETGLVDIAWVQKNILELGDMEIDEIQKGLVKDALREKEKEELKFEPYDHQQQAKTTDTFDTTNYEVPGKDVGREPAQDSNSSSQVPQKDYEIQLVNREASSDDDDDEEDDLIMRSMNQNVATPIKATPFLTRHKRNRTRRVGLSTGRQATAMPNLSAMLSPKNKYAKDITGLRAESVMNEYRKSTVENKAKPAGMEIIDYAMAVEPKFGRVMKSMITKMENRLAPGRKKTGLSNLLTEDTEIELDIDVQEDASGLIVEEASDNTVALLTEASGSMDDDQAVSSILKTSEEEEDSDSVVPATLKEIFEEDDVDVN